MHFLSDATDEPFRVAVRPRCPRWDLDDRHRFGGEHRVEGGGVLRVAVSDQEPERPDPLAQVAEQVAGLLNRPWTGRVRGHTEDVHPPGGDFHHKQHIQSPEADGVEAEEVGRQQSGRLRVQERPPGRISTAGRRTDPGVAQDPPNCAGAHPVTEPDQLTLDAAVAPCWVLPSQPDHQLADLGVDRRATGPVRIRPLLLDQPAVPGQQRAWLHDPVPPQLARQQPGQSAQYRAVRPRQPRLRHLPAQHRDLVA